MQKIMVRWFDLRGELSRKESLLLGALGTVLLLGIWQLVAMYAGISKGVLPSPMAVLTCIPELHTQDALIRNLAYSLSLNLSGMAEAALLAIPLGFLIGLVPFCRGLVARQLAVFRYSPLTILVGLFMNLFGLGPAMKINFLAAGIFVYLLPTTVQRVDEVASVYVQTVTTLGATKWQTFRWVYLPDVLSRVFTDLISLAPISWTYIIIAEMLNMEGGLGALAYTVSRQSRADKNFAILAVIILIGVLLDWLFKYLDRKFFPFKYVTKGKGA